MTQPALPDGFLLVSQAARRMGASERHVRELYDSGVISGIRTPTGYRLIDPVSLENYRPYLSVHSAACELGVAESAVREMFDSGRLRGFRTPRGHRRIDPDSVKERAC